MPLLYNGQFGGLADSKYSGAKNSFYKLIGIDGISEPGILKIRQALADDDSGTIDALCKVALSVSSSVDNSFWFSATSGKIWRRSSGGVWVLVHTTTPAAGDAGCLGAIEFDGYIYWATESRLHRIAVANIGSAAAWTANAAEDWATFARTDDTYHPMSIQGQTLYIGDARGIATVDTNGAGTHTFTATADLLLDLPHRISAIIPLDTDLVIGTTIADNVHICWVVRWDGESESYQERDEIYENGVSAFWKEPVGEHIYGFIGQTGHIYAYDGAKMNFYTRIPGTWGASSKAIVHPNAVSTYLGQMVFGLSNVTGDPAEEGVYTFGHYDRKYPLTLDFSYPISERSGGALVTSGIQIGNVFVIDDDLFVAWKYDDNSDFGVDKLDTSTKLEVASIETGVITPPQGRSILKTVYDIFTDYASLPSGTDIDFSYKKVHEANYVSLSTDVNDSILAQKRSELSIDDVASFQIKITFTTSSNDAPELETIGYRDNISKEK